MDQKKESNKNQTSPIQKGGAEQVKIPKKGKIGALAKNIEKKTDQAVVQKVMRDIDQFESASNRSEKAEWINEAIERLEEQVGKNESVKIMENCGRDCCGSKHSGHAKQLMSESKSIELKDKNTIAGEFNKCYCSMVNQSPKPFSSNIYCHCSIGWIKQLFEPALEKPVDVKLVQSVITGAKTCKFLIYI
jgi:predicted hydrocarbon binding protein